MTAVGNYRIDRTPYCGRFRNELKGERHKTRHDGGGPLPSGRTPEMNRDTPPDGSEAPDTRAPDDARVCLVATRAETFQRCREGFYPAPRSYDRTREQFAYMAFYRTAPVSAVTHYAPVTGRIEQERGALGPMTGDDWAALIDPFSGEDVAVVFELGDLVSLADPVENDLSGVRGAWYPTLGDLRSARRLSEL